MRANRGRTLGYLKSCEPRFFCGADGLDKTIITSINTLQIGTVDDYDYVIHSKVVYEAAAATEDDCWDD